MNVHQNIAASLESLANGLKESLSGLSGNIIPAEVTAKATAEERVLINRINIAFKEAISSMDVNALEKIQKEVAELNTKISQR